VSTVSGRVLVLGLGLSGYAAAEFLAGESCRDDGVTVTVMDEASVGLEERADRLRRLNVDVRLGVTGVFGEYDLVVASPGIPPHDVLMREARALGVPVISELELAFRETHSPFVAVTGTNGKTTVTALIAHILAEAAVPVEAVGNIGSAAIEAASRVGRETVLVVEVSSFQLAGTEHFRPRVSVLLNITPDHLDWHGSFAGYSADKAKIFANQGPDDVAVIDVDDPGAAAFADKVAEQGVRVIRVSLRSLVPGGAGVTEGKLSLATADGPVVLVGMDELPILGRHNVSNALAAAAAARAMGAPIAAIRAGLLTFKPIEHRLEPVDCVLGVEYFNDSKATNPDAVIKALTAFEDRPIVLLLGGRNKGNDFRALAREAASVCRAVILFGEARDELIEAFKGVGVESLVEASMLDALKVAVGLAVPGDALLLSPACASFDEFTSYEQRGQVFKQAVAEFARAAREDS
jgi:UDP-N-acetylmuramoylalanine--D-glutamate ligase